MNHVDQYLQYMMKSQASDLHLASGCPPMIRVHGQLDAIPMQALTGDQVRTMALQILSQKAQDILFDEASVDFVYDIDGAAPGTMSRFRANAFLQKNGLNMVFRGIPPKVPTLAELGLPDTLEALTHHHHGLVLVVGPSGCGKSSTLAAMINAINVSRSCHIITVEDPIEYVFENKLSLIVQRQVGTHVDYFTTALRAALREDPDVVVVGEMRDLETISMAISAAETGHLVLGTLHTRSAVQTVQRLIDSFPPGQQSQIRTMLSESLRGVFCQQLVPKKDGTGRVAAYELLMISGPVGNMIREGKDFQLPNVMQMGKKQGMRMMDDTLMEHVQKGTISGEIGLNSANDPKVFADQLKGMGVAVQ